MLKYPGKLELLSHMKQSTTSSFGLNICPNKMYEHISAPAFLTFAKGIIIQLSSPLTTSHRRLQFPCFTFDIFPNRYNSYSYKIGSYGLIDKVNFQFTSSKENEMEPNSEVLTLILNFLLM